MASVIESQKQEIAGLKLAVEVVQKAQEATKKYLNSMSQVQRREAREQAEIESAVQGGDDKSMRAIFERHGLLAPKSNPAPSR